MNIELNENVTVLMDLENPTVGMGEGLVKLSDGLGAVTVPYRIQGDGYNVITAKDITDGINRELLMTGYKLQVVEIITPQ